MINEQAALYSSVVFQWIILAAILVVASLYFNKKMQLLADKINKIATDIEKQIETTEQMLVETEKQIDEVVNQFEDISKVVAEGNLSSEQISVKIHDGVLKLDESMQKLTKIKEDLKAKLKFK